MTLILNLTPEQESRIGEKAARLGLKVQEYVERLLDSDEPLKQMPRTGAEAVDYWEKEGVLGIWGDRTDIPDSPEFSRELRRRAEARS